MRSCIVRIFAITFLSLPVLSLLSQVASAHFTVYVPESDNENKPVYIAGSFNYWHAGDSLYKMEKRGPGQYHITLPVFENRTYKYKYTQGSWDNVEVDERDSNINNRFFYSSTGINKIDTVIKWKITLPKQNPQLDKINAMKDSVLGKLKPELESMVGLLKDYVQNFLQEHPSKRIHDRLDKKASKKIGEAYQQVTGLFWNVISTLTPEQKISIKKILEEPGEKDYLNRFFDAFNKALEEK